MRIVFVGPPGAGKGTQAAKLIADYRLVHLSTGDMLRAARDAKTEIGLKAEGYMAAGQLVPDEVIVEVIGQRLREDDCRQGYLLDGFPRTIAQAEALDALLAQAGTPLDLVLEIRVAEDELFRRLAGRGRADDSEEVIRQRLVAYRNQTEPLLAYYSRSGLLKTVDGLGTVEEIYQRIQKVLGEVQ
ncbi:MAG: adenylate kinase [Pirellulales bacterium]|nr:adenylate kinase [Pirellulales bacterium]